MKVSGQLHASATFLSAKEAPVPIQQGSRWTSEPVWAFWSHLNLGTKISQQSNWILLLHDSTDAVQWVWSLVRNKYMCVLPHDTEYVAFCSLHWNAGNLVDTFIRRKRKYLFITVFTLLKEDGPVRGKCSIVRIGIYTVKEFFFF